MVVGEINAVLGPLPRQYGSFSLNNNTKQNKTKNSSTIVAFILPSFLIKKKSLKKMATAF